MSGRESVDRLWRDLAAVVHDNRDGWKRAVVERSGLPFSRIRILQRLRRGPLSVKQVAAAATVDAPAATVAINDLEDRGLVRRQVDPANRRRKAVSLTDAGLAMIAAIDAVDDPAPEVVTGLDEVDLANLRSIVDKLIAD